MYCIWILSAVDCGLPDDPAHGKRIGDLSTYTNRIEFSCDPGYFLVGARVSMCQHTGKWSYSSPICQGIYFKSK